MYRVRFYKQGNGKSPISDFIDFSEKSLRLKIGRQILHLEEFGLSLGNPSLKKLTGTPFWEVRILGRDSTRIICVAFVNKEIFVVHIFKKKSNKTSPRDLDISLRRYKEELSRIDR